MSLQQPSLRTARNLFLTSPVLALVAASILVSRDANAQDAAALATRRELIAQAQQARTNGDHEQSLALAERASRIQMSPSLRLFVAQEQFALGRMAEAYGNADQCMRDAEADNTLRNREQVASTCRALATDLRGRIARVTVQVPSPVPSGLVVRVAGNSLADALWGVPYVVTAGPISIDASAPGYRTFHQEMTVAAGATSEVPVTLERVSTTTNEPIVEPSSEPPATVTPTPSGGHAPIGPIVVMGVGAVGIILAPVFYFALRAPAADRANAICPNFMCADQAALTMAQPHRDAASTWNALTWVAGGVGVAAVAGGLAWLLLTRPRANASAPVNAWHVAPTPDGFVVGVHGSF